MKANGDMTNGFETAWDEFDVTVGLKEKGPNPSLGSLKTHTVMVRDFPAYLLHLVDDEVIRRGRDSRSQVIRELLDERLT